MQTKLNGGGITCLKSLFDTLSDPPRRDHIITTTAGLSNKKADKWLQILTDTSLLPGTFPPNIYHRRAANPYTSRFPPDPNLPPDEEQEWEKQIAKSAICNKVVSINKLIDHIFIDTKKHIH